jgi:hypothetical protein
MRFPSDIIQPSALVFLILLGLVTLSACGKKKSSYDGDDREPASVTDPATAPVVIGASDSAWQKLDDPVADGWDSEVVNGQITERLKLLSELIVSDDLSTNSLAPMLAANYSSSDLVPDDLEKIFESAGWRVERGATGESRSEVGVSGFASSLRDVVAALGGEPGDRRCEFKTVEIEMSENGVVATREMLEMSRPGAELHAVWQVAWQVADPPLIRSIQLESFERTTTDSALPFFRECTESVLGANASFQNQIVYGANHWLPRIQDTRKMTLLGSPGAALGDVDGDGLDDLYLCQAGGLPNLLYLQNPDGSARDASAEAGVDWVESSRSALIVDFDNDGDQDLAVATYARIVLAENDGAAKFSVVAILEVGVGTMGMCAADVDNDGDLDLYASHYSAGDLANEAGATVIGAGGSFVYHDANNGGANFYFRNDGNWQFSDATLESGLDANNRRFSLAASWEDFDNDGDQDLYVANDFGRNNLYRNEAGYFTDIAAQAGSEDRASGMSVSWGDANRDGQMDLYVGNMFSAAGGRIARQSAFSPGSSEAERAALLRFARGNTLLVQEEGGFVDRSETAGVTMGRWAWSSLFADIDNDGWEDLLVANGYISTPDSGDL